MKAILITTTEFSPLRGGIGTYTCEIAAAAQALGGAVTVFAPSYGTDPADSDRLRYPFEVIRYPGEIYDRRALPGLLLRLWRVVGERPWDLIHAVDWPTVLALGLIRRLRPLEYRATVHGTELLGVVDSLHVRLLAGGRLFAACERVLANSDFTSDLLSRRCPFVQPEKVAITPLGVAERFFEPPDAAARSAVTKRLSIPDDRQVLLTVARLVPRKGHRVALKALRLLPGDVKQGLVYVIAGRGDPVYEEELRRLAAETEVRVIFAGAVGDAELVALYGVADLFLLPGEPDPKSVEGFGLVYLEAAAQGTPAVASRLGAIPEVVRHQETGLLVEACDHEGLTAALADLLNHPNRLAGMGAAARERARDYTWERCARLSYEL